MIYTQADLKRHLLFVPCETKEALYYWILEYLGLDMPDTIVDPDSNSTPMDIIWEVYDLSRTNRCMDFSTLLAYASRDSFKTLAAAVLEVLGIVHLGRNVAHMAAIEPQAQKAQLYVRNFFKRPVLREFLVGDNDRKKEVTRFYDAKTGKNLTTKEFERLTLSEKMSYEEISNYVVIVICTPRGANSEHVPFFVVDEVDLANPVAYEESKMIPGPINGQMPLTLLTSTRKYSFGLVQKEIDAADETGLEIRHWNIIDVTERCPDDRHLPKEPKVKVYYSDDTLQTILPSHFEKLDPEQSKMYKEDEAFAGCVKNCKMFAMCRGRLATKQKMPTKGKVRSLLKPVAHTQNQFKKVDLEVAKAQLLCRKPSTAGLIYPYLDRVVHMITPAQMAEKFTGEPQNEKMTKEQMLQLFKTQETRFASGMDFGFTHMFAVTTAAVDGNRCFVFDQISVPELEVEQQVEVCDARIKDLEPKISADPENPQAIVTFKRKGYRIVKVDKPKGSVVHGIELLRSMIRPAVGDPRIFFLKGDDGCELLFKRLAGYHWKMDAAGKATNIPDEDEDDECDSCRYLVMANFARKGKSVTAGIEAPKPQAPGPIIHDNSWMAREISHHAGGGVDGSGPVGPLKGKKGGFFFDM